DRDKSSGNSGLAGLLAGAATLGGLAGGRAAAGRRPPRVLAIGRARPHASTAEMPVRFTCFGTTVEVGVDRAQPFVDVPMTGTSALLVHFGENEVEAYASPDGVVAYPIVPDAA